MNSYEFIERLERQVQAQLPQKSFRSILGQLGPGYSVNDNDDIIGLNLSCLNIETLPESVFELEELIHLEAAQNRINKIPLKLFALKKLEGLGFSDCLIEEIPTDITTLSKLKKLSLHDNWIREVPIEILNMNIDLNRNFYNEGIILSNNPITKPPIEIIKQGKRSVINWFKAQKQKLNEIKIILIGEPKAGKTSLLRRLKNNTFNPKEVQTDGINIEDIEFGKTPTFKKQCSIHQITGHFWDFGGQEIMNNSHRFFLTNRSIYVLLVDARKDKNISSQIRGWAKNIKATGGNSQIIVVANQIDVNAGFGFTNQYQLQKEFPQIKYFIKASCKDGTGIDEIKFKLEELIPQTELFVTEIDKRWLKIKNKLVDETTKEKGYFLNEERFIEICDSNGLNNEREQKDAIEFLHDLGIVLHFEQIPENNYYVLNPYWITYGVYQILTSSYAGKVRGIVGMDQLEYIINKEESKNEGYNPSNYDRIKYLPAQRRFLLDIMNQFKLCYCIHEKQQFILPDLLSTVEPKHLTDPIRIAPNKIYFVYEYEYLPGFVLHRFMVDAHKRIETLWRTGCILKINSCTAFLSAYQDRLSIRIVGEGEVKRQFMSLIRYLIESINNELRDQPVLMVPLPGTDPIIYADYEELLERHEDGEKFYKIYKPKRKKFKIADLIYGIPPKNDIRDIINDLELLKNTTCQIKNSLEKTSKKVEELYNYLISRPENLEIEGWLYEDFRKTTTQQLENILDDVSKKFLEALQKSRSDDTIGYEKMFETLSDTDDVQMKLKIAVPLLNLIGLNLETEFDMKKWAKKMYKKHQMNFFKMLGSL